MKRQDHVILKKLSKSKIIKNVSEFAELPLVLIKNDTSIDKKIKDEYSRLEKKYEFEGMNINDLPLTEMYENIRIFNFGEFLFLNKLDINIKNNDFRYSKVKTSNNIIEFANYFIDNVLTLKLNTTSGKISLKYRSRNKKTIDLLHIKDKQTIKIRDNLIKSSFKEIILIGVLFKVCNESDLYAVSKKVVKNKQHKKHKAKKPWEREDLISIVFLNRLPVSSIATESKGGHHASPHYHHRRGTWVHLTHEIYKNHPKFGDKIYRKGSWVGEKSKIVNGTTYTVL